MALVLLLKVRRLNTNADIPSQKGETDWFRHKSSILSWWEKNKSETEQLRVFK